MIFLIIDYVHSPFRQYQELQTIVHGTDSKIEDFRFEGEPVQGTKPLKTDLRLLLVDWGSNTDLEEMIGPHKSRIGEVRGHGPDTRGERRGSQKAISGGRLLSVYDYR